MLPVLFYNNDYLSSLIFEEVHHHILGNLVMRVYALYQQMEYMK